MNDATATDTLTRDQVLDQVEELARIEHALIVEYLSVQCALGHDLEAAEGGATSPEGKEAARTAGSLAQSEMLFHLKAICRVLVSAGRIPDLGRAASIMDAAGGQVSLDPPTVEQLRDVLDREKKITEAVDHAYARLGANLTPDLFEEDLLAKLRDLVERGDQHAEGAAAIKEALGDPAPPDFLRVPRRETDDKFEQGLMSVSDLAYRLVTSALREHFANPDAFGLRSLATTAMDALDASNRALAQRGLLPAFNP